MSTLLDVAQQYFDAWSRHDDDAIAATFAEEGTYHDPSSGEITGAAIGEYANRLWQAFPDLSFELISVAEAGPTTVAAQWLMRGTNAGPFNGLPPSGRAVSLPGSDFIEIENGRIRSVRGYFDTRAVPEQLGLQVLVQPRQIGPFSFGHSVAVRSGRTARPGAFSITVVHSNEEEFVTIRALSRQTAGEMLAMDGFIGLTLARVGDVNLTVSAWEQPENTRQLMHGGTHAEAMREFWAGLGASGYTSVWTPHHINPYWVRCGVCRKKNDYEKSVGRCTCGELLPEPPPYL